MICKNCGAENLDEAKYCKSCGQELQPAQPEDVNEAPAAGETESAETSGDYSGPVDYSSTGDSAAGSENTYSGPVDYSSTGDSAAGSENTYSGPVDYNSMEHSVTQVEEVGSTTASIVSLILGIASIVCCCTSIIPIGCGIAAIILAVRERNQGRGNNMTTAGLVCGIIGLVLGGLALCYWVIAGALGMRTYGVF